MPYGRTRKASDPNTLGIGNEQVVSSRWGAQMNVFTSEIDDLLPRTSTSEIDKFKMFVSALSPLDSSTITGSLINNNALVTIRRKEDTWTAVNRELAGALFICLKSFVARTTVTFSPRLDREHLKLIDVQGIDVNLCAVHTDSALWLHEATLEKSQSGEIALNGTIFNPLRADDLLPVLITFPGEASVSTRPLKLVRNHSTEPERNLQAKHLRYREESLKNAPTESLVKAVEECIACASAQCTDLTHWVEETLELKDYEQKI